MKEYFSREADRYMTSLVLRYNSEKNESEKLKLENIVVERTKVMLYLIPLRSCLIAEEELSGFLLDVMKDISRFITSFTISFPWLRIALMLLLIVAIAAISVEISLRRTIKEKKV